MKVSVNSASKPNPKKPALFVDRTERSKEGLAIMISITIRKVRLLVYYN
jgi:hypothetical protein